MDLSKFLLATDTDTLKNDDSKTGSVTMPGSTNIAGNGRWVVSATIEVGKSGASTLGYFKNSKEGDLMFGVSMLCNFQRTGTVSGSSYPYTLYVTMRRNSSTSVTFEAFVPNPYNTTLRTASGNEVFTFLAKTIVEPF